MSNTHKKWKPGQCITLWGRIYRIRKSCFGGKYKVCCFCNNTGKAPCINAQNYPARKGFTMMDCSKKMPEGCYPRQIDIKSYEKKSK